MKSVENLCRAAAKKKMKIKRKLQRVSIWLMYHFSCLHSYEHSMRRFRREYRLYEEMGRGGFGVVYRGFRAADGAPVAVKFVAHKYVREWIQLSNSNQDEPYVLQNTKKISAKDTSNNDKNNKSKMRRFRHRYGQMIPAEMNYLRECADLDGVVNLIDWFASPHGFLMVMDRPNNCMDLFDVISVYGRLDEEIARQIFAQIVTVVVELLQKYYIVHRDIKDENIIVDMETGAIQLVDFGAADYLEQARFKDFQGTKSYCPPEWFKRNCYLPLESTVWSLGVLLYIMLTGNNPFKSEIQICVGRPKFPDYVSLDSQDLIKQCLNPSTERRIHLEEILKHRFFNPVSAKTTDNTRCSANADAGAEASNGGDSGHGSASSSFRRRALGTSRRPFHALLHRRSMRRKRRRDCEQTMNLTDDLNSESSSEAECSYRQSINTVLRSSPAPITVPQHVIDAAAKKISEQMDAKQINDSRLEVTEESSKLMDSSSGFETAAEELDECTRHPLNDSQYESHTESYLSCHDPRSQLRRRQLMKIHEQRRVDSRGQLLATFSQSSYKSAVSEIVLPVKDTNAIIQTSLCPSLLTSSSDAATSDEELFPDAEYEMRSDAKLECDDEKMTAVVTAADVNAMNELETTADETSLNLYFSALEESSRPPNLSQPSTDFWSASEIENNTDNGSETLINDCSINENDITITIADDASSVNEDLRAGEDSLADGDHLNVCSYGDNESDDRVTPTLRALTRESAGMPLDAERSGGVTPLCEQESNTPEIIHSPKSSTLSPPVRRKRSQRRLSRRLRDAKAVTRTRDCTNSSGSDDSCSFASTSTFEVASVCERRERSVPSAIDRSIQLPPSVALATMDLYENADANSMAYRKKDTTTKGVSISNAQQTITERKTTTLAPKTKQPIQRIVKSGSRYRKNQQKNAIVSLIANDNNNNKYLLQYENNSKRARHNGLKTLKALESQLIVGERTRHFGVSSS